MLIQPIDANSPQGQMIKNIYGAGLNWRMALVNDLLLTVVAADPEKEIHALIDQAKSGAAGPMPSEVQAALQLVPEAKNANFFGTYNEVRAIEMILTVLADAYAARCRCLPRATSPLPGPSATADS